MHRPLPSDPLDYLGPALGAVVFVLVMSRFAISSGVTSTRRAAPGTSPHPGLGADRRGRHSRAVTRHAAAPRALIVSVVLAACSITACSESSSDGASGRARALEARLLAPCCWAQTLDVHESEITPGLRAEILERLRAGEAPDAIEDDFAARYGERIRAVPTGAMRPEDAATPIVLLFLLGSALGIASLMRRERGAAGEATEGPTGRRDDGDRRIDDELERMDGP